MWLAVIIIEFLVSGRDELCLLLTKSHQTLHSRRTETFTECGLKW